MLLFVTYNSAPARVPVSVVSAFTLLLTPRLNTPPTPVPASAVDANSSASSVDTTTVSLCLDIVLVNGFLS